MEYQQDGFGSYGGLAYDTVLFEESDIIIQGIPYESATSGKKGASFAPEQLRLISKDMQTVSRGGIDLNHVVIKDLGNIPIFPIEGEQTREIIERYSRQLFSKSKIPLVSVGGDHSCTYPILKALQSQGKVGVIWFDAHRDLLSELLGSRFSHGSPLGRAIELENIDPRNVLLVGTRYMHPEEETIVNDQKINELRMVDLEADNFSTTDFERHVRDIASKVDFLYVSIDIDVLDPAFAPGTGTPVGGGLSTRELMKYLWAIPSKIRAVDIMEVSPVEDQSGITVKATLALLTEIIAKLVTQ